MQQLLVSPDAWKEIKGRVKKGGRRYCAVAYFGQGGSKFLPLKRNDVLVVDMSLACVRQGATDPREIKKLMERGVLVFSRGRLHSKVFVLGGAAIVGSTNVSSNSLHGLEEAVLVSTEALVVAAAKKYVMSLATEPVRPGYLEACLGEYQPPRFKAFVAGRAATLSSPRSRGRARHWFLAGLADFDVPEAEVDAVLQIEASAKKLRSRSSYPIDQLFFDKPPKYVTEMRKGDWVIQCVQSGQNQHVEAPGQLLSKRTYRRSSGAVRTVLNIEIPPKGERLPLGAFRKAVKGSIPKLDHPNPRSTTIVDGEAADTILSLWKHGGKLRKPR